MGKLKKIINNPELFFRDFLLKRHPLVLSEAGYSVESEVVLINSQLELYRRLPNDLNIDVVFTWVDGSDFLWRQRLEKMKREIDSLSIGAYAADDARFENHEELRYSLMSVNRYLPWVNNIYIVTDQQCPEWIGIDARIKIIDHRDIIDSKYLPTFNSHVIEANIHKIPGLSEHFIYFNDDVFVARPLPKNHFFFNNGIASNFLAKKSLQEMRDRGVLTPTLNASTLSSELLSKYYGSVVDTPLVHTYVPLRKSMFELAWERHDVEIKNFLGNRFRGENDLNLATFLVPWLTYFEGLAAPSIDVCYYFNTKSAVASMYWKILHQQKKENRSPHSFCANDFRDQDGDFGECQIGDMLRKYFVE